jgi:hypothetical protein
MYAIAARNVGKRMFMDNLQYTTIMYITIQWELLLYCLCVVTEIQLYIVKCYVSGYYIVHVSSLPHGYM